MNENLLMFLCLCCQGVLILLDIFLYNKRVKRYQAINDNIIKSLEETIEQRKEIENFFKTQILEDFYKQVWDKLIKDVNKMVKSKQ